MSSGRDDHGGARGEPVPYLRPNQLGAVAVVGLNRTTRVTAAQFEYSAIAYSSPAMVGTSMDRILAVLSIISWPRRPGHM